MPFHPIEVALGAMLIVMAGLGPSAADSGVVPASPPKVPPPNAPEALEPTALEPKALEPTIVPPDAGSPSIDAVWYSDGSCSLVVRGTLSTGVTGIDADMDQAGARTMIHCDGEDGRRVTLLTRGDGLSLGESMPLLSGEQIDEGLDGSIAWLTRTGAQVADEKAARRYVSGGHVLIRATPVARATGSVPDVRKRRFAEIAGDLAPTLEGAGHDAPVDIAPGPARSPSPADSPAPVSEAASND